MIYIKRLAAPTELTYAVKRELTDEFKKNGTSVWRKSYITKQLLKMSHNKCSYCECNVSEESKYMEVEHFHHKAAYKDEVVEWNNLLPSCKKCNGTKSDHDTVVAPIIDPTQVDPRNHLYLNTYRIKGTSQLGKLTVRVLDLNNQDRLVNPRYQIGNSLLEKLEDFLQKIEDYETGVASSVIHKRNIINGIKALLSLGMPTKSYSATVASVILGSVDFPIIKSKLINLGLWDNDFHNLEQSLLDIKL